MRVLLMAPVALMMLSPAVAMAAGRSVTDTCVNAGYRQGTAAFDMCVARVGGDDPLAALEGAQLGAHGDAKVRAPSSKPGSVDALRAVVPAQNHPITAPVMPPGHEEMPPSFDMAPSLGIGGGMPDGGVPAPPAPSAWWPTPPASPVLFPPAQPGWNFGAQ
ncbi:MAG TPA: hypothetical protein VK196_10505 [Magnetospirillum sp.]|nr:hypothetical protein [Magnetospirillum sp.]